MEQLGTYGVGFAIAFVISYIICFFIFGGSSWWDLIDPNSKSVYYGLPISIAVGLVGGYFYYDKVWNG